MDDLIIESERTDLLAVFTQLPACLVVVDADLRLISYSAGASRLCGIDDGLLGRSLAEGGNPARALHALLQAFDLSTEAGLFAFVRDDRGNRFGVHANPWSSGASRSDCILVDLVPLARDEERAPPTNSDVDTHQFARSMNSAHALRSPLNAIVAVAEVLRLNASKGDADPARTARAAATILRQCGLQANLIARLIEPPEP